jgi:hypothetical protein
MWFASSILISRWRQLDLMLRIIGPWDQVKMDLLRVHRPHFALEARHIKAYISLPGSYHAIREGFQYDPTQNAYICRNEKLLYYHGIKMDKGFANHYYHAKVKDCSVCALKQECCGNKRRQSLTFSVYRHYHQRMQERVESKEGKKMKGRRMATVEPVFGSLLNYYGMKRVNAKGKEAAHKFMLNLLRTDVLCHPFASASGGLCV